MNDCVRQIVAAVKATLEAEGRRPHWRFLLEARTVGWDDLVRGALGAVVLVDSRRIEDSFAALDYFERRSVPFVVAVNRFDGNLHHGLDDIREALSVSPNVPLLAIDARRRDDVKATVLAMLEHVLARALTRAATAPT